ncbi:MAG: single-stranded DNA-binding protein [Chloroflexi bacterium]|nr:single-stranded DNA-binding protein [Chloroflexota bacterium]
MGRGLNKVQIIGHLGKDPEMRYTPSGKPVTTFTVAVGRSWNSADGERHNETEWFNVVAWGTLAEICKQYLVKGQQVYVEGRLQTRRWDDKEGVKHTSVEIVAGEMMMLGDRRDSNNTQKSKTLPARRRRARRKRNFPSSAVRDLLGFLPVPRNFAKRPCSL